MLRIPCRFFFVYLWSPLHTRAVWLIANGPWGKKVHQCFIGIFKSLYGIDWPETSSFKTLGEFFLRSVRFQIASENLVSPIEGKCVDGPALIFRSDGTEVKKLHYEWKNFKELDLSRFQNGMFWNFYLAPKNYHWVHAACEGRNLEARRHRGNFLPVNALGRWLSPLLFSENERLTFKWESETYGQVLMICVGAMAVSGLYSEKGEVSYDHWTKLSDSVQKAERLLAFKLGSSVLLLVERAPSGVDKKTMLRVGDALYRSA